MEYRFNYLKLGDVLKKFMKHFSESKTDSRRHDCGGDTLARNENQRTLWRNLETVQGLLGSMSEESIALQETKFEIITTEVSYLKSLSVLITLFRDSEALSASMSDAEKNSLFANIEEVKRCSESFLFDLTGVLEKDIALHGIAQVVCKHVLSFNPYVTYCSRQPTAILTLNRLMASNKKFQEVLREVESSSFAHGCTFQSYLILPLQRITRLPLLIAAVLQRTRLNDEHSSMTEALNALTKIANDCNESIRQSQIFDNTPSQTSSTPVNKTYKLSEKTIKRLSKKLRRPSAVFT